jgi:hypothetical protein
MVLLVMVIVAPGFAQTGDSSPSQEEMIETMRRMQEQIDRLENELAEVRGLSQPPAESVPPSERPAPEAAGGADEAALEAAADEQPLTAGYDKNALNGFFIQSEDEQFRLEFGLYTQARYTMNWRSDAPPEEDNFTRNASMNRTRLFFTGKYTDALDYHFRVNINDAADFDLIVAYLQWNFQPGWSLRVGEQYLALSREDWMFAQDVLGPEFSNNDFQFALGSSIGAQVHYSSERDRFWAALSNGRFGGKETFGAFDFGDIAFTGRYERQLTGDDWSVWDDLVGRRGRADGILLGLAGGYQLNKKTSDMFTDQGFQAIADLSFNGDGYQILLAGTLQVGELADTSDWRYQGGILAQGGLFLTNELQLYGRYELISPGDSVSDLDNFNSIAAGVNFFPFQRTNRWKFTAEIQYLFEALNNTIVLPDSSLGWLASDDSGQTNIRLQAQFGF